MLLPLVVAALATPVAATAADGPDPALRILFTGDSVTHGVDGDYSYRLRVWEEFQRQGVAVDFVGSRDTPYYPAGGQPASYLEPFDSDHFALGATWLSTQAEVIGAEVEKQQPDVVVELLGINDLRNGRTAEETAESLARWMGAVRTARPGTQVVLMQIPPVPADMGAWGAELPRFNELMEQVAATERRDHQTVVEIARTTDGWDSMLMAYDAVHLSATGETFFAQRIAQALRALGRLPQEPRAWRTMTWHRNLAARVTPAVGRAEVRWNQRGLSGVRIWLRRVGHDDGRTFPQPYKGYKKTITGLRPGDTYEIRLAAVRFHHESSLGPVTRVRIPTPPAPPKPPVARPAAVGKVSISTRGVRWTRSTRATSYVVKVRRAGSKEWRTRTVTGRSLRMSKVVRARVWAVNASGRSSVREAVRR